MPENFEPDHYDVVLSERFSQAAAKSVTRFHASLTCRLITENRLTTASSRYRNCGWSATSTRTTVAGDRARPVYSVTHLCQVIALSLCVFVVHNIPKYRCPSFFSFAI